MALLCAWALASCAQLGARRPTVKELSEREATDREQVDNGRAQERARLSEPDAIPEWTPPEERLEAAPSVPPAMELPPLVLSQVTTPPLAGPSEVAVWRRGKQRRLMERTEAGEAGLVVLDVGTEWVPALFRSTEEVPHAYEGEFADLANGRFPDDAQGRRAARDRYLELYGIPPSPALLAVRFSRLDALACARLVPAGALQHFDGVPWPEGDDEAPPGIDPTVVQALQYRLDCEGHLRGRASGHLDTRTRAALEEFERRNRIYARGNLDGDTLEALKAPPLELERRALVRALTERLVLELGVIEDGSGHGIAPASDYPGRYDALTDPPNMVARIERAVERALGLQTVGGTRRFYQQLAPALAQPHYHLALPAIELPSYQDDAMDLFVEIDRGDVYYEFPFDERGQRRAQPVEQRPVLTLFVRKRERPARRGRGKRRDVVIPLARYGTTIGGWRIERVGGRDLWTYKESPVGERVWSRIVSAPVWLPPAGTPPDTLVYQSVSHEDGETEWEVNDNLVGPGYASAYGLVAAYHQRFRERDGERIPTQDEGIRTHGSSDYTSIWQRASHGCHRLHNHLAMRLFNFVLMHRQHRRLGHRSAAFKMPVAVPGFETVIEVSRTGYAFELREPMPVEVLRGTIRGSLKRAPRKRVPAVDEPITPEPPAAEQPIADGVQTGEQPAAATP